MTESTPPSWHAQGRRLVAVCCLALMVSVPAGRAQSVGQQDTDDTIAALLQRLELALLSGNPDDYLISRDRRRTAGRRSVLRPRTSPRASRARSCASATGHRSRARRRATASGSSSRSSSRTATARGLPPGVSTSEAGSGRGRRGTQHVGRDRAGVPLDASRAAPPVARWNRQYALRDVTVAAEDLQSGGSARHRVCGDHRPLARPRSSCSGTAT